MSDTVSVWPRPDWQPTGSRAAMMLLAFSEDPLDPGDDLSASRFGLPSHAAIEQLDVRTHAREQDPGWFDEWRTDALRHIAEDDLADPASLDAARYCHSIRIEVDDPRDLGHVQVCWAVASWLMTRGCRAILDGFACRWWDRDAVSRLSPGRPFALDDEVRFICETEATPGFGHAMHTRGMLKFARPDVICGVEPSAIGLMERVLRRLARMQADGAVIPVGQRLRADESHTFVIEAYRPGANGPQVHLNNDALLVTAA
ncbi:hypothetical protein [Rugosimonospora africana]|uniref:DUF4261 domain-containing protein n=1 Tax=Rugosimonospora africana TaxID=556532 RepID=A0A8J3QPR3_9ACTN|nr:hypothetical protein [Rugosimonospora africana]GIH13997.1 hypothetical protein Raf01_21690 [Rugosimonospora africana]